MILSDGRWFYLTCYSFVGGHCREGARAAAASSKATAVSELVCGWGSSYSGSAIFAQNPQFSTILPQIHQLNNSRVFYRSNERRKRFPGAQQAGVYFSAQIRENSDMEQNEPSSSREIVVEATSSSTQALSDIDTIESTDMDDLEEELRKRKIPPQFTERECILLCSLLENYTDILDLPKNDLHSLKNKVWYEVAQKFNAATDDIKRTAVQLKSFFEDFKRSQVETNEQNSSESVTEFLARFKKVCMQSAQLQQPRQETLSEIIRKYHRKKIDFLNKQIDNCNKEHTKRMQLLQLEEERTKLEISNLRQKIARGRMRLRRRRERRNR